VALATLDIIEREGFPAQAAEKGAYLLKGLKAALESHPHVGDVRGNGLMCGVEFVLDRATKAEHPPEEKVGSRVSAAAQKRGLFSRLRGESVFCLAPPVITPYPVLDRIVEALAGAVKEILD
jgi:L-2,4-diaminobutyrate transaminase